LVNLEDVERLSPLLLEHVNVLGRYAFVLAKSIRQTKLRPLRDPEQPDDLAGLGSLFQFSVPMLLTGIP
jgi:hypothetical protein